MSHGSPKKRLPKNIKKNFFQKNFLGRCHCRSGSGRARTWENRGAKREKRKKSLAKLSFAPHKRFFAYGSSKTKKTSNSNSIINNSNSSNSNKMCGSIWSSHPLFLQQKMKFKFVSHTWSRSLRGGPAPWYTPCSQCLRIIKFN